MIRRVVADASVLIFLGKIRKLHLLRRLWQGPFYASDLVRGEVLSAGVPAEERDYLARELQTFKITPLPGPSKLGGALSRSDWSVVRLARQIRADVVLADDKSLRDVLRGMGFAVLGTLGLLLAAERRRLISKTAAREHADRLIGDHRLHVGVETYRSFLSMLTR